MYPKKALHCAFPVKIPVHCCVTDVSGRSVEVVHTVTLIHCHSVMPLPRGLCFVILTSSVDIALLLNMLTAAPLHCQ